MRKAQEQGWGNSKILITFLYEDLILESGKMTRGIRAGAAILGSNRWLAYP